jgi:hypothetical protein
VVGIAGEAGEEAERPGGDDVGVHVRLHGVGVGSHARGEEGDP